MQIELDDEDDDLPDSYDIKPPHEDEDKSDENDENVKN